MKLILKKYIPFHFYIYILASIFVSSCGVSKSIHDIPDVSNYDSTVIERIKINDSTFTSGNNFLTKNKQGIWELYVEGNPYQLGLNTGLLTQELFKKQEAIFLNKVDEFVPSKTKQYLLRKLLAWYNRKMYLNIIEQYKAEIYGLSKYAANDYNYIADNYLRVLYLHGAHDIGHALQDLMLVGCSSFAAWGNKTKDGKMIVARNFDFYVGDEFAKNKIVAFVNPEQGNKYMYVTWGGMVGAVSGMNEQGITVTINAGKSKIPLIAKTPISLVTKEILQYASNIKEAITIAKKRQVFVSESIFIGSAHDKKAITIEVSPKNFGVFEVPNSNQLICSNHFQSQAYKNDKNNQKQILESHSKYRYLRLEELLQQTNKLTITKAVSILRNKEGLHNKSIGFGNEKALNQLQAHHGIVFKPEDLLVWVSANPYQLGEFVAYDLNTIFKEMKLRTSAKTLSKPSLNIPEDPFVNSQKFIDYQHYRKLKTQLEDALKNKKKISKNIIDTFQQNNPEFWEVYYLVGKYQYQQKKYKEALQSFQKAKTKEITTLPDAKMVTKYIKKLKRKLKL
ncbi:MAG: C45 family autoproteolytic acyltransferase/hydrolase [Flavobacteriales bacterium]